MSGALDAGRLAELLEGCPLAQKILVLEETTSTNDAAAQFGRDGASEGVVVFAEKQTSGRGRFGRKWESPRGDALCFSVLLRPTATPRLGTWAAVAVAEGIEEIIGRRAQIKWPNDIYLEGKKAAGILIEASAGANAFAVLGIGINVNQLEFPDWLADRAVSLRQSAGRIFDRHAVAANVLRRLANLSAELPGDFSEILMKAEARSFLCGRQIVVEAGGERIEGVAESLDENGALILRKSDGDRLTLSSGEVTIVRG